MKLIGALLTFIALTESSRAEPTWSRGAIGYEVFVRSFQDTDGDGIGDLQGVIDRLDHLASLGVEVLWLMPIHPSPSYHGYDVTDFRAVNPEYGGLADLDALVAAAKARGIHVLLDLLLNHTSDRHPWFIGARRPDGAHRDFYLWRTQAPDPTEGAWRRPWDGAPLWHPLGADQVYYALFWSGMPDLALANPRVEREMQEVMDFWLARGVDGFRVDAIRYLIETPDGAVADTAATHAFVARQRAHLARDYPQALLLGEVWSSVEDQASYGHGDELHLAFSFDMAQAIAESVDDGVRSRLAQVIDKSNAAFADRGFEAPFLANHDMPRIMRRLGDAAEMRQAAALLFASPGTPFIYYGEEIGLVGGAGKDDENKRTPMRWSCAANGGFTTGTPWHVLPPETAGTDVSSETGDRHSLLSLYRKLGGIRRASAALRSGDQQRLDARGGPGVLAFVRAAGAERVLVIVNLAPRASAPFELALGPVGARTLVAEGVPALEVDGARVRVPALAPHAFGYFALEAPRP